MKRVFNSLFVLVLLAVSFPALAQEDGSLSEITLRKAHRDNWYISIGPSANFLFAEQDKAKSPLDRVKLGGELSIGKWFNQNTGFSFNVVGGGLKGFNFTEAPFETGYYTTPKEEHLYSQDFGGPGHPMGGPFRNASGVWNKKYTRITSKDGYEGFWQEYNFVTPTFDIMANVTNLFRGYAVDNGWFELIGFFGLGANLAFDNGYSTPDFWWLAGRVGMRVNFNVSQSVAIYLQTAAYATDPEFDGYKGTAVGDLYGIASLGLQYTFNRKVSSFEKLTIDELDRLNRRVNENRDLIENHQDILERQQRLIDKLGTYQPVTERPVIVQGGRGLPEFIRFALDSYAIQKSEYTKASDAVDFMKNNPDAKILLIGYADKRTGSTTHNLNLSRRRVEAVKNEMVRLGINGNRINTEYRGDREQPFGINEWNRVVMMIERK